MTAADPFLRACPRWGEAQRLGARNGDAFEVSKPRRLPLAVRALALVGFGLGVAFLFHLGSL